MAGLCTCRNPALVDKDELTRDAPEAPTEDNSILTPTPATFRTPTFISAPVPAPDLSGIYMNREL